MKLSALLLALMAKLAAADLVPVEKCTKEEEFANHVAECKKIVGMCQGVEACVMHYTPQIFNPNATLPQSPEYTACDQFKNDMAAETACVQENQACRRDGGSHDEYEKCFDKALNRLTRGPMMNYATLSQKKNNCFSTSGTDSDICEKALLNCANKYDAPSGLANVSVKDFDDCVMSETESEKKKAQNPPRPSDILPVEKTTNNREGGKVSREQYLALNDKKCKENKLGEYDWDCVQVSSACSNQALTATGLTEAEYIKCLDDGFAKRKSE